MRIEKILIIILVVLAISGFIWSASSFFSNQKSVSLIENNSENFDQAMQSELDDKCATPESYSEEEWLDHMSHHPDRYADCF